MIKLYAPTPSKPTAPETGPDPIVISLLADMLQAVEAGDVGDRMDKLRRSLSRRNARLARRREACRC